MHSITLASFNITLAKVINMLLQLYYEIITKFMITEIYSNNRVYNFNHVRIREKLNFFL